MERNVSSRNCSDPQMSFQSTLYATTYTLIFIPGLLANSAALLVLCRFLSRKSKAVIFMINLAMADLAHVPLTAPVDLLLHQPHLALRELPVPGVLLPEVPQHGWKRCYDVAISALVWLLVGATCLLLIIRSPALSNSINSCFLDLGVKQFSPGATITLVTVAEPFGFIIPFDTIVWCTWRMWHSLREGPMALQDIGEKQKVLRTVLMCAAIFFICLTPYHINFPFFMMVIENVIQDCAVHQSTLRFHPISLCLASLNCCLDPSSTTS
ncbi:hypothetical protein DUI87_30922 [Hirundo rustica rustica]|uniref:G-protein coupled receptors family 1 profile domain-containing protein n=1 Tax=Hirundo rustica rustica TaxID=333673 RepID=A0A3M0J0U7_HIRRU|nr:hypothetical protein DUI87_30922 [Hirundo rustica rustica]